MSHPQPLPQPSTHSAPVPTSADGDRTRRRAAQALLASAVATPICVAAFMGVSDLWAAIVVLDGAAFLLSSLALGALLACAPLASVIGLLLALWWGVDSVLQPRSRPSRRLDQAIMAIGLVAWSLPLGFCGVQAGLAIARGHIHFARPPRDYWLASDPVAFWQGVGFWILAGALWAFFAYRYWQPRWRAYATAGRPASP